MRMHGQKILNNVLAALSAGEVSMQKKQIQVVRTPDGSLSLLRQTAEKLLAEGVLSGTLDGDLHAADAATVKAAIMASAICDFCSAPGASHYYDVPDFGITTDPRNGTNYSSLVGTSSGGWMACDTCDELIKANKRKQLVDRAIQTMAFPKFTRSAIEDMYGKFWQGMDDRNEATGLALGVAQFVDDALPPPFTPKLTDRDKRIEAMARVTGLTPTQVRTVVTGALDRDTVAKLLAWRRQFGGPINPTTLADLLAGTGPRKPLADITPHWQRALDMKFGALVNVSQALGADRQFAFSPDTIDMQDTHAVTRAIKQAQAQLELRNLGFGTDAKLLRAAEAYSFNGETIAAIREAAAGVPHDTPLSAIETPNTGAAWFWFAEPIPVQASPVVSDKVHALLWGWVDGGKKYEVSLDEEVFRTASPGAHERLQQIVQDYEAVGQLSRQRLDDLGALLRSMGVSRETLDRKTRVIAGNPAIMFSAYVLDEKGQYFKAGTPSPSTRWHWPLHLTFHEMLEYNRQSHREEYGPGTPHADLPHLVGEEDTLRCVAELSLFFVMSCLWFKQTVPVLTREPGQVERHARKRYVREHKLDAMPSVQVVALRKSLRVPAEKAEGTQATTAREYHCRWIVKGHPRLQACGPGRKDKKLIWIEAHPAGPADKPLRTKEKVYAVIR